MAGATQDAAAVHGADRDSLHPGMPGSGGPHLARIRASCVPRAEAGFNQEPPDDHRTQAKGLVMDQNRVLLARIDERTQALQREVHAIAEHLKEDYVTAAEFVPIKKIVYGLVGLVLTAVTLAVLGLLFLK